MPTGATSLVPSEKRRAFLRRSIKTYMESVEVGEAYLASRGFDSDVAEQWQLGVAVEPLAGHEPLRGRLIIPYRTPNGPVGLVGRCIKNHDCKATGCPKYLAEPGERRRLYNVHALHSDSRSIVLTEGELDALASDAIAGIAAVGVPGIKNWQPHFAYLFDGHDEVILAADGDEAGSKLVKTVKDALSNVRVVTMPRGEDVNSYIATHGAEAFRELIDWKG
ncbi:MAG: toprim domain-containing protein [Candidatus Dormibacteraceae bacterium]